MTDPLSRALASAPKPKASIVVPTSFIEFAADWCGVKWEEYPAQRIACGVCFDGEPIPDNALGRLLFGGVTGEVDAALLQTVTGVCGRRGGKTYTFIALRGIHKALTCDLSMVMPGQVPAALIIAPNKKLRREAVNYALGAMRADARLREMLKLPKGTQETDTPEEFSIRRPDGKIVSFEGGVATVGGYGGRGRALVFLALEECAFFRDKGSKVNDEDILKAAEIAVLPDGQTVIMSSPWARRGVLWRMYHENFGHPVSALCFWAPTTVLNPAAWIAKKVAQFRKRDPDAAKTECDAEFLEAGTIIFFDPTLIENCIDDTLNPGRTPRPGETTRAGGDMGLRSDSATLAIGHLVGQQILTGALLELRPEPGKPLKPSEVAKTFAQECAQHGVTYYTADGHYWDSTLEHMGTIPCAQATLAPHEYFVRARMLMREGRPKMPRNDRLIQQMQEVEGRPVAGGGMKIHMPRWNTGGHGDLAQAWVLMVSSFGGEAIPQPKAAYGTAAWELEQQEKRRKELLRTKDDRFTRAPWRR